MCDLNEGDEDVEFEEDGFHMDKEDNKLFNPEINPFHLGIQWNTLIYTG